MGRLFKLSTVILVAAIALPAVMSQQDCEAMLAKSDKCFKTALLLGDTQQDTPLDMDAMDSHCKQVKSSVACFRSYNKCLKNMPRQIFGMLTANLNKFSKEKCSPKGKAEFLKQMTCLTPEVKPKIDGHINKFSTIVDYIAVNVTKNDKFSWACCSYHHIMKKLSQEFEAQCPSSSVAATKYMKGALTSLVADIMEVACGKFNSVESCTKNAPKAMSTLDEISAMPDDGKSSSMLKPLISMAKSLDEKSKD